MRIVRETSWNGEGSTQKSDAASTDMDSMLPIGRLSDDDHSLSSLKPLASPKNWLEVRFSTAHRSPGQPVGLVNLGLTCFMNSALQCLMACPEMSQYFGSGEYRDDLAVDNPLSRGGQLAEEFSNLLEKVEENQVLWE